MKSEHVYSLDLVGNSVRLMHSSTLMTNYESGRVADPGRALSCTTDKDGNPMIFTISPDSGKSPASLYLTHRTSSQKTGWMQVDLTSTLPGKDVKVQAFSVTQFPDGKMTMAVAFGAAVTGASTLVVSPQLSNDPNDESWKTLKETWRARPVPASLPSFAIAKITLSNGASGITEDGGGPLMFVVGQAGTKLGYHIVSTGPDAPTDWPEVLPPDGATVVHQLLAGNTAVANAGTFALYDHGQGPEVGFQGAPSSNKFGTPQKFTLSVAKDTNVIAVGAGQSGETQDQNFDSLLTGGPSGLTYFAPGSLAGNATGVALVKADVIDGIKEIAVTESIDQDGTITIWILDSTNTLLHLTADKSDLSKPVVGPFPFKRAVAQIAPVLNKALRANEIILETMDGKLSYLWQDPSTTLWTESNVPLYTTGEVLEFHCYTTALHFEGKDGQPLTKQTAHLRASAWSYVTINGEPYVLTPDHDTAVDTDANGAMTIVQKVQSVAVPNYTISADVLGSSVQIVPSAGIKTDLGKVKSGDDLKNAKDQTTGKPVFKDSGSLDFGSAAQAVSKLSALHPGKATSLLAVTSAKDFGNGINLAAHKGTWGLIDDGTGKLRHVEGQEADEHLNLMLADAKAADSILGDIAADAGDALRWVEHGVEKVAKIVVSAAEDGVQFIVKLAKATVKFVVNTAEQVLAAVSYVLKQIGATLEKIIQWIGLLFAWDDVVATKNALSAYVLKGIDYCHDQIKGAEDKAKAFFDDLKGKLDEALKLPEGIPPGAMSVQASAQSSKWPSMKSSGATFSNYHLQHSGIATAVGAVVKPVAGLVEWMEGVVSDEFDKVIGDTQKAAQQIDALYRNGKLTAEALLTIVADLLGGILIDTVETLAVGGLKLADLILNTTKDMLTAKVDIPFLSAFYKKVTGSDLTLLDGMALLVAIPATLLIKITAQNKPPFTEADVKAVQAADPAHLFAPRRTVLAANFASSQVPPAAVYGAIGSVIGGVTGVAGAITTAMDKLSKDNLPIIPQISLCMALFGLAFSAPIAEGKAQAWNAAGYGMSTYKTMFKAATIYAGQKITADGEKKNLAKVSSGMSIAMGIIQIVPQTGALVVTGLDDKNDEFSYLSYACSLLGDASAITGGAAGLDDDEETKAILAGVALATGGIGSFGKMAIGLTKVAKIL